jgi:DNA-binding PadR family transcriptional regulator
MAEEGRDPESLFGENDTNVLRVIGEEDLMGFTFDGLKRRLGMHPETLSRVLYRLEDEGIVEKGSSGYRVTEKGKEFLRLHPLSINGSCLPLLQTLLSPDVPIQQIVSDLKGKWFGVLRWLGYSKNDEDVTLKWITEDGEVQVDAKFSKGELSIEAKQLQDKDLNSALKASYQLIGYISKLYSRRGRARRVAYFKAKSSLSV